MALRSQRRHVDSRIDCFMNETAERGGFVVASTVGSGVAMDSAAQVVTYAASPSGKAVVGLLTCDVVNIDLTRQKLNVNKEEVQINGKVTVWTKGTVVTNRIYPGVTPAAHGTAYLAPSGYVHTSDIVGSNIVVGKFDTIKDEEGYATISFNLP